MTGGSQEEGEKRAEWVSTKDIHTSYFVSCNQPRPKRLDLVPSYTAQSLFKGVDFFLLATPQPKCSLNVPQPLTMVTLVVRLQQEFWWCQPIFKP